MAIIRQMLPNFLSPLLPPTPPAHVLFLIRLPATLQDAPDGLERHAKVLVQHRQRKLLWVFLV